MFQLHPLLPSAATNITAGPAATERVRKLQASDGFGGLQIIRALTGIAQMQGLEEGEMGFPRIR
jgi:hypothetical protein